MDGRARARRLKMRAGLPLASGGRHDERRRKTEEKRRLPALVKSVGSSATRARAHLMPHRDVVYCTGRCCCLRAPPGSPRLSCSVSARHGAGPARLVCTVRTAAGAGGEEGSRAAHDSGGAADTQCATARGRPWRTSNNVPLCGHRSQERDVRAPDRRRAEAELARSGWRSGRLRARSWAPRSCGPAGRDTNQDQALSTAAKAPHQFLLLYCVVVGQPSMAMLPRPRDGAAQPPSDRW